MEKQKIYNPEEDPEFNGIWADGRESIHLKPGDFAKLKNLIEDRKKKGGKGNITDDDLRRLGLSYVLKEIPRKVASKD